MFYYGGLRFFVVPLARVWFDGYLGGGAIEKARAMLALVVRIGVGICAAALLAACTVVKPPSVTQPPPDRLPAPQVSVEPVPPKLSAREAAANFVQVAAIMQPRIRAECLARTQGHRNCDYRIAVDERRDSSPNASQSVDDDGRPVIAFNLALIAEARNPDELAFVVGHEAAHHILGHLDAKTQDARAGALIMGVLAAAAGADADHIAQAQDIGADVGERAYSQDYELQADYLGTIIVWNAGYDPVLGAEFFGRLPDPGETFLGTHPPNKLRFGLVQQTVRQLQSRTGT